MVRKDSANYSKGKLAVGYGVIALLIGAIVYLYISEWRQLEKLEQEVKHINVLRQKVHDAYAKKLELAMYGETILEWEATDTIRYRSKRLQLDSLLCEFKQDYPPHRLDSLRRLLDPWCSVRSEFRPPSRFPQGKSKAGSCGHIWWSFGCCPIRNAPQSAQ